MTRSRTAAEEYLEDRKNEPEYRDAYDGARRLIESHEVDVEGVREAAEAELKRLYGDPLPTPADFAKGPLHGNSHGQTVNTEASVYAGVSAFAQGLLRRLERSGGEG